MTDTKLFWGQYPPTVRKRHEPLELGRRTFVSEEDPNCDYCELLGAEIYNSKVRIDSIDQSVDDDTYTNNLTVTESGFRVDGSAYFQGSKSSFRISLSDTASRISAKVSRATTGTVPCGIAKIWFTTMRISARHVRTIRGSKSGPNVRKP